MSSTLETPQRAENAPTEAKPARAEFWPAVRALASRELVRFFRQRNRVTGALGQPLVFWILFAAGLGPSFRMPGAAGQGSVTYAQYFFPGVVVLILLFTAIFATISIIEDRREGFLQSVLVAPISRWSMVLGKLLGGTAIALVQAIVFLALGLAVGISFHPLAALLIVVFLFLVALSLTGLGFVIAWRMDSTQGFHAIMSVFLMPMWLLSGAFFPAAGGWLGWIIRLNPLTYGVAGLRRLLYWGADAAVVADLPSMATCWCVVLLFTAVTLAASWAVSASRTTGDLL